jgi:molecular chaperone GrpE
MARVGYRSAPTYVRSAVEATLGKKPHPHHAAHQAPAARPEREATTPVPEEGASAAAPPEAGAAAAAASVPGAEAPPEDDAARVARQEAEEWRDRALRAAAELENYKKRAARERAETWGRAQADLVSQTLDALDDLGRIAALDPAQTNSQALHEGVGLVGRKLLKVLDGIGLERVEPTGQPFDPNQHEAVMTMPAPSPESDHLVGSVLQPGYRLNGSLLRPARVAVLVWTGSDAAPGAE